MLASRSLDRGPQADRYEAVLRGTDRGLVCQRGPDRAEEQDHLY